MNKRTDEFISDYQRSTNDRSTKQAIGRLLTKLNIKAVKLSNNAGYKYKKTCKELTDEYNKNNWMDEENDLVNPVYSTDRLDVDIFDDDDVDYKALYEDLLKKQTADLSKVSKIKTVKIIK